MFVVSLLILCSGAYALHNDPSTVVGTNATGLTINSIPFSTRAYWIRFANGPALNSSCPHSPFGTVIVNHTAPGLGTLICTAQNNAKSVGNPTHHGEILAIANCTQILQAPPYNLTASGALAALQELSIYTNAESCTMCASAIRFAGFKEYIFGTSIPFLTNHGWSQIALSSYDIFQQSILLGTSTQFIGNILGNETDPKFAWQFVEDAPCPTGCVRATVDATPTCTPTNETPDL